MSDIPSSSEWYWAEIIEEIRISGEAERTVLLNTVLVHAGDPDAAYERAQEIGRSYDGEYVNTDGQQVTCRFAGLRDIGVIYDGLVHGAELFYSEETGVSDEDLADMATPKEHMTLFSLVEDEPE
jgi:hypothetical protein